MIEMAVKLSKYLISTQKCIFTQYLVNYDRIGVVLSHSLFLMGMLLYEANVFEDENRLKSGSPSNIVYNYGNI